MADRIPVDDFSVLLDDVLDDVRQNLERRRSGIEGSGSVDQLERIVIELEKLAEQLNAGGPLPPPEVRWLEGAQIVIDSWPPKEKLGERICMIDYLYRHNLDEENR